MNSDNIGIQGDDYSNLIKEVGVEKFRDRLKELMTTANNFILSAGYEGVAECNERIMYHALLDYYSDIYRLKDFHGIEYIRDEKLTAYTVSWIVKRKPIQLKHFSKDEIDIFINERFGAWLFIDACLRIGKKGYIPQEEQDHYDDYVDLILYYLKYRPCNPLVLELALESFLMGASMIENDR